MRPRPVLHETEAKTKTNYCETETIDVNNVFYVFYSYHVFYVFNVFYFHNVFINKKTFHK